MNLRRIVNYDAIVSCLRNWLKITKPRKSSSDILLWDLLKTFNHQLSNNRTDTSLCHHIQLALNRYTLSQSQRLSFARSVMPLLLKNNQLDDLEQVVDFNQLSKISQSKSKWVISTALGPLILKKNFKMLEQALERLSSTETDGWLETESVLFCVNESIALLHSQEISLSEANKIFDAYFDLLENVGTHWFSRLYDENLQLTMVAILKASNLFSASVQVKIHKNSIAFFGLSSFFWHQLLLQVTINQHDKLLNNAYQKWYFLYHAITEPESLVTEFDKFIAALDFFEDYNNPDVALYRKEFFFYLLHYNQGLSIDKLDFQQLLNNGELLTRYQYFPFNKQARNNSLLVSNNTENDVLHGSIWPTFASLDDNKHLNQLLLMSEVNQWQRIIDPQSVTVIAVMRNEMIMLPHFLSHYRKIGCHTFLIADNGSNDGTREYLLAQDDVILYSVDTEYKDSHYGVAWQQAMMANHCVGRWVLLADADELLIYPDYENKSLNQFVETVENKGHDCVRVDMVDMYPYGDMSDADFTQSMPFDVANWYDDNPVTDWRLGGGMYSNHISCVSTLRHRIDPDAEPNAFASQKYALIKYGPWIRLSEGIHDVTGVRVHNEKCQFAHFKYHAGFKAKVKEEIVRKQHYAGAADYHRYAAMLAETNGYFGDERYSKQLTFNK